MYLRADGDTLNTTSRIERWEAFGPYYAMFPVDFAFDVIDRFSAPGELVVDPFCGRGTSIFAAAASGRRGFGVEINPVGWIYGATKLAPAMESSVLRRLNNLASLAARRRLPALPPFFTWAYSRSVLRFLCTARAELDWKHRIVDRTLMAFILVYLHGKREASFSNQMRQTKSMSPDYSVAWWRERNMHPPDHDPVEFLAQRIYWRYKPGIPDLNDSIIRLGDARNRLSEVHRRGHGGPYFLRRRRIAA